jgi:Uma2 family endonuclease
MAQPVWNLPVWDHGEPDEDDSGVVMLQRVVEQPDGSLELLERPPTLEEYLDPQIGDKLTQNNPHGILRRTLTDRLERHFEGQEGVFVLEDVKHLLARGLPRPSPDISVIRGARDSDPDFDSFDCVEQGALPGLVIEIISPSDARIRRWDEVNKKALYQRAGISEYLLVDMPRRATKHRFLVKGYRLGADGEYRTIEPDGEGRILSETTQLRFGTSEDGQRVEVFDAATGEKLLTAKEEQAGRKAAEAELARLRAEIERLKKS